MSFSLTELYENRARPIITAHRGACAIRPENTLAAMETARSAGADLVEFDLRLTADGIPVLMHDDTLDRTTSLTGPVAGIPLAALRRTAVRPPKGCDAPTDAVPTFADILRALACRIGMNIQVYAPPEGLRTICRLYCDFNLFDSAYLTIARPEDIPVIRHIHPRIEICFTPPWTERATPDWLRRCKDLGCRFVQPVFEHTPPEAFALCDSLGLRANVFYADTPERARQCLRNGAAGFLTNHCQRFTDRNASLGIPG